MKQFKFENLPHNPIMPNGVRIGETIIDGYVMYILKELFKDVCDGYIAPRMISPFHPGDYAHEEIVFFNPNRLKVFEDNINNSIIKSHINDRISFNNTSIKMKWKNIDINIFMKGGIKKLDDDKNIFFYNKKNIKEAKRLSKGFSKLIKKNIEINSLILDEHPHIKLNTLNDKIKLEKKFPWHMTSYYL